MRRKLTLALLVLGIGCSDDVLQPPTPLCPPDGLVRPGNEVTPPVLIEESIVTPEYPAQAWMNGIEGRVILHVSIATDGAVCATEVFEVDPAGWGFEDASAAAAEQWRYEPALHNGEAVSFQTPLVFDYTLN